MDFETTTLRRGDNNDAVYKSAMETASAVIRLVDPNGGDMSAKRVDNDNDPVGVLMNAAGTVRALVIPFAQNLDDLRALVAEVSSTRTRVFIWSIGPFIGTFIGPFIGPCSSPHSFVYSLDSRGAAQLRHIIRVVVYTGRASVVECM